MDDKINVLAVDDLPSVTKRLKKILLDSGISENVRVAASGREAVVAATESRPDVVLMDISMETRSAGIEATRTILSADPTIKIIMLTVYEDEDNISDAFQAGVVNYVLKDAIPSHIVKIVRDAYLGTSAINPKIARVLIDEFKRIKRNEERFRFYIDSISPLSFTEMEILKLLCAGKTRAEICEERGVEESTVKTQIRSLLIKLKQKKTKNAVSILKELNIMELIK